MKLSFSEDKIEDVILCIHTKTYHKQVFCSNNDQTIHVIRTVNLNHLFQNLMTVDLAIFNRREI